MMKNIGRRKKLQQPAISDESGGKIQNLGLWKEIENLKTDKNALMQELVKLRQHQETSDNKLLLLGERLHGMEKNQQQMLSFLVMAMQSPAFLVQMLRRMAETASMLEVGTEDDGSFASDAMIVRYQPPVDETPTPVQTRTLISENQEVDPSPEGLKDFLLNADFLKMLMDEKLCSLDNHAPFILPDLPDDGSWEQLLFASPFLVNTEDGKLDSEEHSDYELEMETSVSGSQLETSREFELLIEQMEKSQTLGME